MLLPVIIFFEILCLYLINQKNETSDITSSVAYEKCLVNKDNGQRLQCWEDLIDSVLNKEGLDQAFILVGDLFEKDRQFASNCHSFAHKTGEFAYDLYSGNKQFSLTAKTSYCGYGFYHGFMEKLLNTTDDLDQARSFCEFADAQLAKKTIDAKGACYHGIGHGAVDGEDPRSRGNAIDTVNPGLQLCEKVSVSRDQLFRCTSGAFNALEILMSQGQSGLGLNGKDPFWICRFQPEKYKRPCYTQMVVAAKNVAHQDFIKTAEFIDTIVEDDFAIETLEALAVEKVNSPNRDYSEMIGFCRGLKQRFKLPCIKAYGEGFLKYGPPQTEYIEAIKFCSSELLSESEHKICFGRALSLLRNLYTVGKSEEICNTVEEKYRWNKCVYQ